MPNRAALFLPVFLLPGLAAGQVPAGGEFQANTYTTGVQSGPSAALDAAGRLVVTWSTPVLGSGVHARRFDAAGAPLSDEFPVAVGGSFHTSSHVASSFGGDFVVTWVSWVGGPFGTAIVRGRRFSADGAPDVSFSTSPMLGFSPMTAWMPADGFVVVWDGRPSPFSNRNHHDILGQRFAASGANLGAEFRVNTFTYGIQRYASGAVNSHGDFLVAWQEDFDWDGFGVDAQRFTAAGARLGGQFRVNDVTTADQTHPRAAIAADGGFVVVWRSEGQDGSGHGVFGRRFARDGTPIGTDFQVNTYIASDQSAPAVAADVAGNFVVTWTSLGQDGSAEGVFAQRFTAFAVRRGAEFQVNTTTAATQYASSVAMDPFGNMSVVWSSVDQDGSGPGVFGQRFGGLYGVALAVDTSGNRVLEPGETVDMRPSWHNLNGAAQTFGGSLTTIVGPPGATYSILDPSASYGTVANGSVAPCVDCYDVAVSDPPARPSTHWDAFALESIVPDAHGQQKPWALHVGRSFTDVSPASPFYGFIETLLHRGVTSGCGATTYCPTSSTTREQMAVFVLVSKEGPGYAPPACGTPVFADVPASSPFCRWIEDLVRRGVTSGCGGGNYCPADAVSREQMAVFVLRTLDPALDPPACGTPVFADVPASSPFCRWIEELVRRGVVTGCGGGNYCPAAPVSREQMGVFLGVTFGLTLYGG